MIDLSTFQEIIEEHVNRLNIDWFNRKKAKFESEFEFGFDKKTGIIFIEEKDYSWQEIYDDEDNEIIGTEMIDCSITHQFNLQEYCACYLPLNEYTDFGSFPDLDLKPKPKDAGAREIADNLISDLSPFFENVKHTTTIYNLFYSTLEYVGEQLNNQKSVNENRPIEYIEVLDKFLSTFNSKLARKYNNFLIPHELGQKSRFYYFYLQSLFAGE